MNVVKCKFIAMHVLAMLVPYAVFAAPPLVTDDPGTPGPRRWEINSGFVVKKSTNKNTYQAPSLDLNYGVGENIQLNYSVSWIVLHSDGSTNSGLGNSEIAIKWRCLDQDKQGIDMSLYPRLIINNPSSADRGIVDKGTIFRLPFQMEKKIGIIAVNPEVGYDFHEEGSDEWMYGLTLKYAEVKGLEMLAEIFGTADKKFSNAETAVNIGVREDVLENVSLHASIGTGLGSASNRAQLLSYAGFQLRF